MAVVTQLNLNVGTEQNPNFVLHDINDKRISTIAVTTATHLLTCNSGVTSIAPITAANLASVLGGVEKEISVPANSSVDFPVEEFANRAFLARNGTTSSINGLFYKAGSGAQLSRLAGSTSGLSINDETPASLHISRIDGVWKLTNNSNNNGKFIYHILI